VSISADRDDHEDADGNVEKESGPFIFGAGVGAGFDISSREVDLAVKFSSGSATDKGATDDVGSDCRFETPFGFIQPGAGIQYETWNIDVTNPSSDASYSEDITEITPYFDVALEVTLLDWIDFRLGGSQYITYKTVEGSDDAPIAGAWKTSRVEHQLASGVGLHPHDDVRIDVQISTDWYKEGPNFISGRDNTFGLNSALSYTW
jgi:hypothetical protein